MKRFYLLLLLLKVVYPSQDLPNGRILNGRILNENHCSPGSSFSFPSNQEMTKNNLICGKLSDPSVDRFTIPISEIWFNYYNSKFEFIIIEHEESGELFVFGFYPRKTSEIPLIVSSPELYDLSPLHSQLIGQPAQIIRPVDPNRKVGIINWNNQITPTGTTGPIFTPDPRVECRIAKESLAVWCSGYDVSTMHMRCSVRDAPEIEHNFHIQKAGGPLMGGLTFFGESTLYATGYTVVRRIHNFIVEGDTFLHD